MSLKIGQVLTGRHGAYKVSEVLKAGRVFKASIFSKSPPSVLREAGRLEDVVLKTEQDDDKLSFQRELANYKLPGFASCPTIRVLRDCVGHDHADAQGHQPRAMVFEWMDHQLDTVDSQPFSSGSILPQIISKSILQTLAFLNRNYHGIHTDISPNNVLLHGINESCPKVKVADYDNLLPEGYKRGTIQSLETRAPEVWRGLGCWHSSDVWSVGLTLVHWLSHDTIFGPRGKVIDDHVEAWCIAKMIRLVGPIEDPVDVDEEGLLGLEVTVARYLETESYEDPQTGQTRPFITLKSLREELEALPGVPVPQELIAFIEYLLVMDHTKRPTAEEALCHPYLKDIKL